MPFKPPVADKCQSCQKSVYQAEEKVADGMKWHKFCFKCETEKCPKCGKSVYKAEERAFDGYKWHNFCFKCGMCGKMLDSTTVAVHGGACWCKVCYGKKFGPKGYGFGGGAGALSTETGSQFGCRKGEMSNAPTYEHVGESTKDN